jgi:hypothetical protein
MSDLHVYVPGGALQRLLEKDRERTLQLISVVFNHAIAEIHTSAKDGQIDVNAAADISVGDLMILTDLIALADKIQIQLVSEHGDSSTTLVS